MTSPTTPPRTILVHEGTWVRTEADVGAARRHAQAVARDARGVDADRVALVASELASNLVSHTRSGGLLQAWRTGNTVELLTIDDGTSDAHRPGLRAGIKSIEDSCDALELELAKTGSLVHCRFGAEPAPAVGACVVPMRGYDRSGDGVWLALDADGQTAVVVDVLGHGAAASAERDAILGAVMNADFRSPRGVIDAATEAVRQGRGCAIRWAHVRGSDLATFSIGNVGGMLVTAGRAKKLVDHAGVVGRRHRPPPVHHHAWGPGSRLVLFTDGLSSRRVAWTEAHGAVLTAGRIWRAASRDRDDAALLVLEAE